MHASAYVCYDLIFVLRGAGAGARGAVDCRMLLHVAMAVKSTINATCFCLPL